MSRMTRRQCPLSRTNFWDEAAVHHVLGEASPSFRAWTISTMFYFAASALTILFPVP